MLAHQPRKKFFECLQCFAQSYFTVLKNAPIQIIKFHLSFESKPRLRYNGSTMLDLVAVKNLVKNCYKFKPKPRHNETNVSLTFTNTAKYQKTKKYSDERFFPLHDRRCVNHSTNATCLWRKMNNKLVCRHKRVNFIYDVT